MSSIDTSDRGQVVAFGALEELRRLILAQLETTAVSAALTLGQYARMEEAVAAEGSIGSVWPDASEDHAGYVAVFGSSIDGALAALDAVVRAAWTVRTAGEAAGLAVLSGLPPRV